MTTHVWNFSTIDDLAAQAERIGDPSRLLSQIRPRVHSLVSLSFRTRGSDAEDVTQEVLLRVVEGLASYDTRRPFWPWLRAIARNEVHRALRRKARATAAEEVFLVESQRPDDTYTPQDLSDTRQAVQVALFHLTQDQKQAVRLTQLDGLSFQEAAAEMSRSEAAVKMLVERGLQNMRKTLETAE